MDVAWFLKQRVGFIRQLYRDSTLPFVERMRLIEEEQPPYVPPYSEDSEPAFISEWIDASDSVQVLGLACVSMLAGALHVYFETWEHATRIIVDQEERKRMFKKIGWFRGYKTVFAEHLGVKFEDSGADLALLEQVVLARNRAEHPEDLIRVRPTHGRIERTEHRSLFFLDDRERKLLADAEANGMDMDSVWMIESPIHVDAGKLETALAEVERFATWCDEACCAWLYGRKD